MSPPSAQEIAVDDPTAPEPDSPAVTTTRTAEVVVYVLLLALALLLGFDNWRSGMGWAKDGPQSGYLPFYLCVILAGASDIVTAASAADIAPLASAVWVCSRSGVGIA